MELRLKLDSGRTVSLAKHYDVNRLKLSLVGQQDVEAFVYLTDQEAETLARELFALSGKP